MVTGGKPVLLVAGFFLCLNFATAAMPPAPNYCEHMGYNYTTQEVENASYSQGICRFSENSSCPAEAFMNGSCGQEHVKDISCREKGEAVFPQFESCCGNMEPYLPPGAIGQPTCQPEKSLIEKLSANLNFFIRTAGDILLG
ncbi:MAG: hypothetical protein ABEJ36_03830 [Candidatus Nanosalina sp.]